MSEFPGYVLNGRTYKTVNGLSRALAADCGCDSHSMVRDGRITCTVGRMPDRYIVATYAVSTPKVGEPMTVTRVAP